MTVEPATNSHVVQKLKLNFKMAHTYLYAHMWNIYSMYMLESNVIQVIAFSFLVTVKLLRAEHLYIFMLHTWM